MGGFTGRSIVRSDAFDAAMAHVAGSHQRADDVLRGLEWILQHRPE